MPSSSISSTPYKKADAAFLGDGFIRDGPPTSRNEGDLVRLHRDYLQGLEAPVIHSLPWPTPKERFQADQLLQQRTWAKEGWSKSVNGVVYSVLTSIIVIVLFLPQAHNGVDGVSSTRKWLRVAGICLAVWNTLLMLATLGFYVYYVKVDGQLQHLVRCLMDETGIGASSLPHPNSRMMSRDDSSQQGIFELPEFIGIVWRRASLTPSQSQYNDNTGAPGPPPSDQISNLTFG